MTIKLELTCQGRKERTYLPTHDQHDNPLHEALVIQLLRVAVLDLFYLARGDVDRDLAEAPPEPVAPDDLPF